MADDKDFHDATWERGLIRRKNSYRYRRTVKGKRICEIWGEIGLTEATRRAQRLNLDIDDAIQHGRSLSRIIQGSKSKPVTFERFATDVWLPTKAASIQPTSVKRYQAVVDNFVQYLKNHNLEDMHLDEFDHAVCKDYLTHRKTTPIFPNGYRPTPNARKYARKSLRKKGVSKKTMNTELMILRSAFTEAHTRNIIARNPWSQIRCEKVSKDEKIASHHKWLKGEREAFQEAAYKIDETFGDIVTLVFNTGLRKGEVVFLEWTDVDLKKEIISIRAKDVIDRNETIKWRPKASEGDIPLNKTAIVLLRKRSCKRGKSTFVFPAPDGYSCQVRLLRKTKSAAKLAGIKKNVRFHDLRHAFATSLVEKGVRLQNIMFVMRHHSIQETEVYAKTNIDLARESVKALD